jgi:hypothetical protein
MAKDAPRQARRRQRKSQGLPASEDVGILAEMLGALRNAAEVYLDSKIYYALAACPNLVALYHEDIEDTFEYLSLKSLDNPNNLFSYFASRREQQRVMVLDFAMILLTLIAVIKRSTKCLSQPS